MSARRRETRDVLTSIAHRAYAIQVEHGHPLDGCADAIVDATEALAVGDEWIRSDATILRGTISARRNNASAYHEAIVPVLEEALAILDGLLTPAK